LGAASGLRLSTLWCSLARGQDRLQLEHVGALLMAMLTRQESKRDTVHAVLEDLIHIEPRLEGPLQKALLLLSVYTSPQDPTPQPL
jgi:hypothetical protein